MNIKQSGRMSSRYNGEINCELVTIDDYTHSLPLDVGFSSIYIESKIPMVTNMPHRLLCGATSVPH